MKPKATKLAGAARALLFVYVLIILAPFSFIPEYPSVDHTWFFALNWGAAHGLAVGKDLIWTTGPLWYLAFPMDIGNNLSQALVFQWIEWAVLAAIFTDLFFLCGFALRNVVAFAIFFGLSAPFYAPASGPENRLVAGALALLIAARFRGGRARYAIALMLAGLIPLIKLTGGMLVAGAIIGFVLEGARRQRSSVVLAATVPTAVAVLACRLTMPSFASQLSFIKGSVEITSGYNAAMSVVGDVRDLGGAVAMLTWIGALGFFAAKGNPGLGRFFALLLPLPLFVAFKHSFVRQDLHVVNFFCFAGLALGLISLAMTMEGQRFGVVLLIAVLYSITWYEFVPPHMGPEAYAMVDGADELKRVREALHPATLQADLRTSSEAVFPAEARLEPELRAIIGDSPVAEMALIYSSAWIDRLNLKLFPVVQRYTAYNSYLDNLNATWLREHGPRFLIADWEAIDGRDPYAETPAMWLEAYRWYDTRKLGSRHLLLERRDGPRFSSLRSVRILDTRLDQSLDLSAADFWSLSCGYRPIGALRKFLLRVAPVTMTVNDRKAARVPMEVLNSPLVSTTPGSLTELAGMFEASSASKPRVNIIEFGGPGIVNYGPVCQVEILTAR